MVADRFRMSAVKQTWRQKSTAPVCQRPGAALLWNVAALTDPLHCPDPQASRRWAYGRRMLQERDWDAARDLFEQALEHAPDFAPAWADLGQALAALGDPAGAGRAFGEALRLDPADRMGAGALLGLTRGETAPELSPAYVARLFDDYAARFEGHLLDELHYDGPGLIGEALERHAAGRTFAAAVDLGCGTGLAGPVLRPRAARLEGVDLSAKMVGEARKRGIYDALWVEDVTAFLRRAAPGAFDCLAAADVFLYLGDLAPPFAAGFAAMKPGGLFVFTLERLADGDGLRLGEAMRFQHSEAYVERTARAAGLEVLSVDARSCRTERGAPVAGMLWALGRA